MAESDRQEPASVEDVMASIRQAIEAETKGGSSSPPEEGGPASSAVPEPAPQEGEAVIHLTQMVTKSGDVIDLSREPAQDSASLDDPSPGPAVAEQTVADEQPPEQENLGAVDPLQAAGAAAITKYLSQTPRPIEQGPQLGGGHSLEEVVRQALVPHVREWLEANLGPLVQNIVREEIEEMVRRKKDE